jgi:hypothetical protein
MSSSDLIQLGILIVAILALIITPLIQIFFHYRKKKEARFQLHEQTRISIRPLLKTNNALSDSNGFSTYFKIEGNDATDFSIEIIEFSKFNFNLRLEVQKTVPRGGLFVVSGFLANIDRNVFSNYQYKYAILFRDMERNRYKAIVEAKGMSAYIVECKPIFNQQQ